MKPGEWTPGYFFDEGQGAGDYLISRWVFLRGLGVIYFSAFYALLFQVRGLIGSRGILPAVDYMDRARALGWVVRVWYVPTLLWVRPGDGLLVGMCWVGLVAAVLVAVNVWPRMMLLVCFLCFLSFVGVSQEFGAYQSDGMLLEAGFLALFMAPAGLRPGWGRAHLGMRAAHLLLVWEWFRIYFESGLVKLASGDPTWRNMTAMYEYYQNGPLPTWVGWYLQHLPHWFHMGTAVLTLVMELGLVWLVMLPGRWRVICFWVVTGWQAGVILTANYAFLNYLVLLLGILLVRDDAFRRLLPERWFSSEGGVARRSSVGWMGVGAVMMIWVFYATAVPLAQMILGAVPLPMEPITLLEPFRIAGTYGLFANMTPHRYEIEFQGSDDGVKWVAYPFRYKPQDVRERPGIYAPYQPRFDWNLWFASLGTWEENGWVVRVEGRLLEGDGDVLRLFRGDPFGGRRPVFVRAVIRQYWFSSSVKDGGWWRREFLGTYAPTVRLDGGRLVEVEGASWGGAGS